MWLRDEARIAVSITSSSWPDAVADIKKAAALADLIEIRLDCIQDRNLHLQSEEILREAVSASPRPLIFTHRSGRPEPAPNRTGQNVSRLLGARKEPLARDYFDFDLRSDNSVGFHLYGAYLRIYGAHPRIILSQHDFNTCGEREIMRTYQRISTFMPDVIKIAGTANRIEDALGVFALLDRAQSENRALIALAMGAQGRISRILAPSRGGFLTFAALLSGAESAPGQFTLEEMLSIYRVKSITENTKIYALLGNPVNHSVSPHMHNAAFAALGIDAVYLPIEIASEELSAFIDRFVGTKTRSMRWDFKGASVTIPHKISIMQMLDDIDANAKAIGAVNTIAVKDGRLIGYNTDAEGAISPIEEMIDLRGAKAAILGAGGAARSVIAGLIARGADATVYARDISKASRLAEDFGVEIRSFNEASQERSDLLINTTPIGMKGWKSEASMPIKAEALARFGIVYDLVYNPIETELLKTARAAGAKTLSGIEMLLAQAAEQFKIWTGAAAPVDAMRRAAMKKLGFICHEEHEEHEEL